MLIFWERSSIVDAASVKQLYLRLISRKRTDSILLASKNPLQLNFSFFQSTNLRWPLFRSMHSQAFGHIRVWRRFEHGSFSQARHDWYFQAHGWKLPSWSRVFLIFWKISFLQCLFFWDKGLLKEPWKIISDVLTVQKRTRNTQKWFWKCF